MECDYQVASPRHFSHMRNRHTRIHSLPPSCIGQMITPEVPSLVIFKCDVELCEIITTTQHDVCSSAQLDHFGFHDGNIRNNILRRGWNHNYLQRCCNNGTYLAIASPPSVVIAAPMKSICATITNMTYAYNDVVNIVTTITPFSTMIAEWFIIDTSTIVTWSTITAILAIPRRWHGS